MSGYSRLELSGGSLDGYLYLYNAAQAFISGGIITDRIQSGQKDDTVIDTSVITIYGTGFNYPYGPILDVTGILTGTLLNGDPINNEFRIYDNASIILAIPEPASVFFFVGGICAFLRKRSGR